MFCAANSSAMYHMAPSGASLRTPPPPTTSVLFIESAVYSVYKFPHCPGPVYSSESTMRASFKVNEKHDGSNKNDLGSFF